MFWKAYALGMNGHIHECLQQLEIFSSRKDMQYPVTLAQIYFHSNSPTRYVIVIVIEFNMIYYVKLISIVII
jgi:hypothetical protein